MPQTVEIIIPKPLTPTSPGLVKVTRPRVTLLSGANVVQSKVSKNPLWNGARADIGDNHLYDYSEFLRAEDVESYMMKSHRLHTEMCIKQGFSWTGPENRLVVYVQRRMREITVRAKSSQRKLLSELCSGLVKFSNAFIILVRRDDFEDGRHDYMGRSLNPISSAWIAEAPFMYPRRNNGRVIEWEYRNPSKIGTETKIFPAHNVIHIVVNQKGAEVMGTPYFLPVLDDIRVLRRIEEFDQLLISKHLFPLFHYKVGTEKQGTITFDDGSSEVDIVRAEVENLDTEGYVVTSHRHTIEAIGSKDKAIDLGPSLLYFEKRVIAGLDLSEIDLGRGDSANRSTATVINQSRADRCITIQQVVSDILEESLVTEFLLELGLDPFDERFRVSLKWKPINTEEQRLNETHQSLIFLSNLRSHSEAREAMGERPWNEEQWADSAVNTVSRISAEQGLAASEKLAETTAQVKQTAAPANQTNKGGKPRPKTSKNDELTTVDSILYDALNTSLQDIQETLYNRELLTLPKIHEIVNRSFDIATTRIYNCSHISLKDSENDIKVMLDNLKTTFISQAAAMERLPISFRTNADILTQLPSSTVLSLKKLAAE